MSVDRGILSEANVAREKNFLICKLIVCGGSPHVAPSEGQIC